MLGKRKRAVFVGANTAQGTSEFELHKMYLYSITQNFKCQ